MNEFLPIIWCSYGERFISSCYIKLVSAPFLSAQVIQNRGIFPYGMSLLGYIPISIHKYLTFTAFLLYKGIKKGLYSPITVQSNFIYSEMFNSSHFSLTSFRASRISPMESTGKKIVFPLRYPV